MKRLLLTIILATLTACAPVLQPPTITSILISTSSPTPLPTATQTATAVPTLSPTPDPYFAYTNDYLRSRVYGGGQIEFVEVLGQNLYFTRYLMRYPSDGLNIYGFANIPNDAEKHPVIIALHGYIDPAAYNTLDYTTHYADALSSCFSSKPARLPAIR
jgi:uncharacterized protein